MSVRLGVNSFESDILESDRIDFDKAAPFMEKKKRFAIFKDLGVLEYKKALELQIRTLQEKIDQTIDEDYIFLLNTHLYSPLAEEAAGKI